MNTLLKIIFIFCLLSSSTSFAEEYIDYDDIINRLSNSKPTYSSYTGDPFDFIKIHLSLGMVNTVNSIQIEDSNYRANLTGVQLNLGIDLFSRSWRAEGSMRNFSEHEQEGIHYRYQEFDLKILYHSQVSKNWAYYFGAGISARYMNINYSESIPAPVSLTEKPTESAPATSEASLESKHLKSTTPASVLVSGISYGLTPSMSFDTELSFRNAVINETVDKSSFDFTLKLSGHF